jgi:GGDEF domain-containing protein
VEDVVIAVAASVGAVLGTGDDRARDLLRAADEEMYRVKVASRAVGPPAVA